MNTEINNGQLTHDKIQAEIARLFTELEKMRAETAEVNANTILMLIGSTATLAIVAGAKPCLGEHFSKNKTHAPARYLAN